MSGGAPFVLMLTISSHLYNELPQGIGYPSIGNYTSALQHHCMHTWLVATLLQHILVYQLQRISALIHYLALLCQRQAYRHSKAWCQCEIEATKLSLQVLTGVCCFADG